MSPVLEQLRVGGAWVWSGAGPEPDAFVSGLDALGEVRTTQPTIPTWDNTGHTGTLTTYSGPGAGLGVVVVSTPGTVYDHVDFGSARVQVTAANCGFRHCRWYVTDCGSDGYSTAQVDFRATSNTGGGFVEHCTVENVAQSIRGRTGIMGWNVRIERTRVRGFVDQLGFYVPGSPGVGGLPLGVLVLDTFLGEMAWCQHPTGGVVHLSDMKTHCDCVQFQGGYGARLINVVVIARYSTTVGTGTPGSGSDTGWAGSPYTQAEAEALRYATVFQSGILSNPATRGYALGGSISGIMVNTSNDKGLTVGMELAWVYGAGGAYWLNAGDVMSGSFGSITHLRVLPDQRGALQNGTSAPWQVAIVSGTTLTMTNAYEAADTTAWASTGTAIIRRNA